MLKTRVLTALVGVFGLAFVITYGGYVFDGLMTLLALLGWREYTKLHRDIRVVDGALGYGAIAVSMACLAFGYGSLLPFVAAVVMILLWISYIASNGGQGFASMANTFLGIFYVATGFMGMMVLRNSSIMGISASPHSYIDSGAAAVWLVLLCIWASDTFAYFTGLSIGKHHIVPNISPNKTLEGFIGGAIGTVAVAYVLGLHMGISLEKAIAIGMIIAVFAPLGDLFESKMKRACHVKDSGVMLPGHGGVLDRFDSLLVAVPVLMVYLLASCI